MKRAKPCFQASHQTIEKPRRAREGRSPLELKIELSDMRGERGAILSQGNPISRRENSYLADFAPGDFEEILAKSGGGGSGGGAGSPVHQLVKTF